MIRQRNHIFKVMTFLFKLWIKYPALRFGQLLGNAISNEDIYYIEDKRLIKKLKFTYKRGLPENVDFDKDLFD